MPLESSCVEAGRANLSNKRERRGKGVEYCGSGECYGRKKWSLEETPFILDLEGHMMKLALIILCMTTESGFISEITG